MLVAICFATVLLVCQLCTAASLAHAVAAVDERMGRNVEFGLAYDEGDMEAEIAVEAGEADLKSCSDPYQLPLPASPQAVAKMPPSPCVAVVLPWQSGGLRQDAEVFERALPCAHTLYGDSQPPPNASRDERLLFLEHLPSEHLRYKKGWSNLTASAEVWSMVNMEWVSLLHLKLPTVSLILCKTRIVCELLSAIRHERNLSWRLLYTRFSSVDRFGVATLASCETTTMSAACQRAPLWTNPSMVGMPTAQPAAPRRALTMAGIARARPQQDFGQFLHVMGKSAAKHTAEIIQAWRENLHFPNLTIVASRSIPSVQKWMRKAPPHIRLELDISTEELTALQASHGVHLCPSAREGYGHYINEGRAAAAFVVTTPTPPMSELVDDASGMLITARTAKPPLHGNLIALPFDDSAVSPADISAAVHRVLALPVEERRRRGRRARARYEEDTAFFLESARRLDCTSRLALADGHANSSLDARATACGLCLI